MSSVTAGEWYADRDPRMHMTAERSSEKLSLHLIQFIVLLHGLFSFAAMSSASLLYTVDHVRFHGYAHAPI